MVLSRFAVGSALVAWLVALLASCGSRPPPPRPRFTVPVDVVIFNEGSRASEVVDSPPALLQRLTAELRQRGIEPTFVDPAPYRDAFVTRRSSRARQQFILAHPPPGRPGGIRNLLLVETQTTFYTELEGRFRWTVGTKASYVDPRAPADAATTTFTAPAILNFPHQGVRDALAYVADPIATEVADLGARFVDQVETPRAEPGPAP